MTPFYQDSTITLHMGDCFDVLKTLADESIDSCVTDPPYGIGFMGREWDTFKPGKEAARIVPNKAINSDNPNLRGRTRGPASSPSAVEYDYSVKGLRAFQDWCEQWGREVFRVLKPGGNIVSCGAPRAYHRMTSGLEDAGFEIRDCLAWLFGSGFPKSLNLGDGLGTALKPAHEPIVLARKPFKGTVASNVAAHGTGALNIDACRVGASGGGGNGLGSHFGDLGNTRLGHQFGIDATDGLGRWPANVCIDEIAAMVIDEQSGASESRCGQPRGAAAGDGWGMTLTGAEYDDSGGASRFYKKCSPDCSLCDTSTDDHVKMSGCETTSVSTAERRFRTIRQTLDSIAPAHAQTSLIESVARRVPSVENLCARCATRIALALVETKLSDSKSAVSRAFQGSTPSYKNSILTQNLASFAELWVSIDTIPTTASLSLLCGSVLHAIGSCTRSASLGSVSDQPRFLYSAKPSRAERDTGTDGLQTRQRDDSRKAGNPGGDNPRNRGLQQRGNFHPTVKPIELMRWLVRLVTPPDGVVLDPFLGSGTTGMACRYEQRRFIGIEREADYIAIAERRIRAVNPLFAEAAEAPAVVDAAPAPSLFDVPA